MSPHLTQCVCSYGSKRYTRCYDRLARTADNCRGGYGRYGDYYDRYDRYGGWDAEDRGTQLVWLGKIPHSKKKPEKI